MAAATKLDSTLAAPSHSRLATLHECRRKYYHKYVQCIRARGAFTRPHAGKALHAALDVLQRRGYNAIDDAHRALIASYGDHIPGDKFEYLTCEHLMGVLVNYVKHWREDDEDYVPQHIHISQLSSNVLLWRGDVDDQGYLVMNESPMIVRLSNGMNVTVVIDAIVRRLDGKLWVVDHKATCGYLGKGVLNRYLVSHQPPLYIAAVEAALGERVGGAILNAIFMGSAALSPTTKAQLFDRYTFDYSAGQLAESLQWALLTQQLASAEEATPTSSDAAAWLQNPAAYCAGCDYLQLCEVAPALRSGRIATWYDHHKEEYVDEHDSEG